MKNCKRCNWVVSNPVNGYCNWCNKALAYGQKLVDVLRFQYGKPLLDNEKNLEEAARFIETNRMPDLMVSSPTALAEICHRRKIRRWIHGYGWGVWDVAHFTIPIDRR